MNRFFLCNSAALQANLSRTAFKVYSFLAMGANNGTRSCYHSKETIARHCKISLSSVVRATRELCKKKLLEIRRRYRDKGRQTSNLYILLDSPQLQIDLSKPEKAKSLPDVPKPDKTEQAPLKPTQAKVWLFRCSSSIFNCNLNPTGHKVYSYLSFRAGKEKRCYPSKREIATDCGISISTVTRAIKELQLAGLIEIKAQTRMKRYGNNGASANLYLLCEPPAPKPFSVKAAITAILASFSLALISTPLSPVTPQRTMSRKKVTLKQRKKEFISKITKRISMRWYRFFAGSDKLLAKLNDG